MTTFSPQGQAFNRTRQAYLATKLSLADTHWTRLRGLMGASEQDFGDGRGLWIVPCRGVHTLAMRFPIDVIYLSKAGTVVHVEEKFACRRPRCLNFRVEKLWKPQLWWAIELRSIWGRNKR
jgi:uncharacterized membrane protein (UPF0127 family)